MRNLKIKLLSRKLKPEWFLWAYQDYPIPVPFHIKISTLTRHAIPDADWIETGTYLGETSTKLARLFQRQVIHTIEPADQLFYFNQTRFKGLNNVLIYHGTSETEFAKVLNKVNGKINCWLDGHFSGDVTFQGDIDSPILHELKLLKDRLDTITEMRIFIDDARLFGVDPSYPKKSLLVKWSEENKCSWTIENDIFIISR